MLDVCSVGFVLRRVEMFVSCAAGNYTLRTGAGPIYQDPHCESVHCKALVQEVLATFEVVGA